MLTAPRLFGTVCEKRSGADHAFAVPFILCMIGKIGANRC